MALISIFGLGFSLSVRPNWQLQYCMNMWKLPAWLDCPPNNCSLCGRILVLRPNCVVFANSDHYVGQGSRVAVQTLCVSFFLSSKTLQVMVRSIHLCVLCPRPFVISADGTRLTAGISCGDSRQLPTNSLSYQQQMVFTFFKGTCASKSVFCSYLT